MTDELLARMDSPLVAFREGKYGFHNSRKWKLVRALSLFSFALCCPLLCSAYSLVLRDGRRIEIPETFSVSTTNLVYESSPGLSVSLQMSVIDVGETEKANGEAPGALYKRISGLAQSQVQNSPNTFPQNALPQGTRRTITNDDLEKYRRQRVQNEESYDREAKATGAPSREQLRASERESEGRLREIAAEVDAERARVEALQAQQDAFAAGRQASNGMSYDQGYTYNDYLPSLYGNYPYYPILSNQFPRFRDRFGEFGRREFPRRKIYLAPSLINRNGARPMHR